MNMQEFASPNREQTGLLETLRNGGTFASTAKEGTHFGFAETPTFLTLCLSFLRDTIDLLPDEEKAHYMEAARIAPGLVQAEADPIRFLRIEKFNVFAAARRIVVYWEYRRKLFGERWLYPMRSHNPFERGGILLEEDKRVLQSGWCAVIPPALSDPFVVAVDGSRLVKGVQTNYSDSMIRVLFYLCTAANHNTAQTEGITIIKSMLRHLSLDFPLNTALLEMIHVALPIKVKNIICVRRMANNDDDCSSSLEGLYIRMTGNVIARLFGEKAQRIIRVEEESHATTQLQALGIPKKCIPETMGGEWSYSRLMEWQSQVNQNESIGPVSTSALLPVSAIVTKDPARKQELSKQRNALYSRRSYQKRKARRREVEDEIDRVINEQERLVEENEKLESLYKKAKAYVDSLKTDKT